MWKAVAFRGAVDKGDSEEVNASRLRAVEVHLAVSKRKTRENKHKQP